MKVCSSCQEPKSLEDFAWKIKSKGTKASWCRSCQAKAAKQHYENNKALRRSQIAANKPKYVGRNREFIKEYLLANPCVDCGQTDIRVLQFDHIIMVRGKGNRVSSYIGSSLEKLKAEISKCEVRCANCHFMRTREQMGWDTYL